MNLETRIRRYHCGEANAIKSSTLEKLYHCSGSIIRKQINELRCNGALICSTNKGYFYASNALEANSTIEQLTSRIQGISAARKGMIKALEGGDLVG